jgi:hypothetical protein
MIRRFRSPDLFDFAYFLPIRRTLPRRREFRLSTSFHWVFAVFWHVAIPDGDHDPSGFAECSLWCATQTSALQVLTSQEQAPQMTLPIFCLSGAPFPPDCATATTGPAMLPRMDSRRAPPGRWAPCGAVPTLGTKSKVLFWGTYAQYYGPTPRHKIGLSRSVPEDSHCSTPGKCLCRGQAYRSMSVYKKIETVIRGYPTGLGQPPNGRQE